MRIDYVWNGDDEYARDPADDDRIDLWEAEANEQALAYEAQYGDWLQNQVDDAAYGD